MNRPNPVIRGIMVIIAAAGICCVTSNSLAKPKNLATSQKERIREVLTRQVEAWNHHDLEGFMSAYWKSPDLTFFSTGTGTAGWQATLDRYRGRYQGEGREMGTLDFNDLRIEMLGPRAAFVRGKWHLKMKSGDSGGLFTLIFRRFQDGWKIIHDHTSAS